MSITTFPLGPLEANCHLAIQGTKAVAIDPAGDPAPVIKALADAGCTLSCILLTHLHFDHLYGTQALHRATQAEIFASQADAWLLENEMGLGGMWNTPQVEPFTFTPLSAAEHSFAGLSCKVIATPGHTPGGLCFYFPALASVFTGDTLFYRSLGRSDFPRGDGAELVQSIQIGLFSLPDETAVYPGHGPATSIGEEKLHNPYLSDMRRG